MKKTTKGKKIKNVQTMFTMRRGGAYGSKVCVEIYNSVTQNWLPLSMVLSAFDGVTESYLMSLPIENHELFEEIK
jgi:hypothetical protein